MTRTSLSRARARQSTRKAAVALTIAGSVLASSAALSAAQAQSTVTRRATVVKVVTRQPFGKMLATIHGRSLYVLMPGHTCGAGCLPVWPRLLMPRGKTIPLGTRCLETARAGSRLQVTYRDRRLYLFAGDSGSSVNGNGQGGFVVARVRTGACP